MRILIITTFFPPINSIASLRPYTWAKYWVKSGHDVVILTQSAQNLPDALHLPNHGFRVISVPRRFESWLSRWKTHYHLPTSGVSATMGLIPRIKKKIKDKFKDLQVKKGIFRSCRMPDFSDLWTGPAFQAIHAEEKWDLVVSSSGPYTTHAIAFKLKKKQLTHSWIADFRDPWSDNQIFPGIFPFNQWEKYLEKKWMSHATKISTVSHPLKTTLSRRHGSNKVVVIENGIDPDDYTFLDSAPFFESREPFRIVHTGTIYDGINNPYPLLEAIKKIRDQPLVKKPEVIFVGNSGQMLPKYVQEHQLQPFVKIYPSVNRPEALRMQRDADLLLFLPWGDLEKEGILSGKIFEYLYSMTPIISIGGTSTSDYLSIEGGFVLGTHFGCHSLKIEKYLRAILSNSTKPSKILDNQTFVVQNFTREKQAFKLLESIGQS
jgi:glycosyltransferase involved in cell wall biosynthesis